MYERYTDRARAVMVEAQQEAKEQNHNYIGTEHLLLGILREGDGLAAIALNGFDVDLETARRRVLGVAPAGEQPPDRTARLPLTPHAHKVCARLALLEALALGHNYIGTEHELLGLITDSKPSDQLRQHTGMREDTLETSIFPDDKQSVVGDVLVTLGVELDDIHGKITGSLLHKDNWLWRLRTEHEAA